MFAPDEVVTVLRRCGEAGVNLWSGSSSAAMGDLGIMRAAWMPLGERRRRSARGNARTRSRRFGTNPRPMRTSSGPVPRAEERLVLLPLGVFGSSWATPSVDPGFADAKGGARGLGSDFPVRVDPTPTR